MQKKNWKLIEKFEDLHIIRDIMIVSKLNPNWITIPLSYYEINFELYYKWNYLFSMNLNIIYKNWTSILLKFKYINECLN